MYEKGEHQFAQETQRQKYIRQNKLPLNFFFIFFFFIVTFTTFSNIFLRAKILHKTSKPFIFFEISRSFGGAIL